MTGIISEDWLLENLPSGWTYDCRFDPEPAFIISAGVCEHGTQVGGELVLPLRLLANTQGKVAVKPTYSSIQSLRDICEPWITLWQGDEWGESMWSLHGAAQTSYGLNDEDCAIVVAMLWRNIASFKDWVDQEGHEYDVAEPEGIARAQAEASKQRDYWLKGGNLGDFADTIANAKAIIDQLPGWVFGDPVKP